MLCFTGYKARSLRQNYIVGTIMILMWKINALIIMICMHVPFNIFFFLPQGILKVISEISIRI